MGKHQQDKNAKQLWEYFQAVIEWTKTTFTEYRPMMKGVAFGSLYNNFKNKKLNPKKLEIEIKKLIDDEDVTSKKGIYTYVLTREEKELSIRAFTPNMKLEAYERQNGICLAAKTHKKGVHFEIGEMDADHITPWIEGGPTISENCQMLCKGCNRTLGKK